MRILSRARRCSFSTPEELTKAEDNTTATSIVQLQLCAMQSVATLGPKTSNYCNNCQRTHHLADLSLCVEVL